MVPRWTLPLTLLCLTASEAPAQGTSFDFGGRATYQLLATSYPEDSLFRELTGSSSWDHNVEARLSLGLDRGRWDLKADYQLIGYYGDRIAFSREFPPELQLLFGRLPEDDRRLFDLTHVFEDQGQRAALQRLDRVSLGFTADKGVARFGRQAVSWGNGLIYTPMDIFNPFDPAAVDKEYKTGDDMLYGQYLRDNGHDLQGVVVFRRSLLSGDLQANQSSFALKYHGFGGVSELDLLAAQHYGEPLVGAGGSRSLGGAVWRGDLTLSFTDEETVVSLVTSLSYSWVWGGKNLSGVLEYFFSGFGQPGNRYDTASLEENPALLQRFARGELFTLGRHYVVASALVELHPLFHLTPNVFANLADPSALIQLVTQTDVKQDLVLRGALSLPVGASGSEFGGIETEVPGEYLSSGPGVFVQLAWYF